MNIYDTLRVLVEKENWTSEQEKREHLAVIESALQNNIFGTMALRNQVQAHQCIAKPRWRPSSRTWPDLSMEARNREFRERVGPDTCQICGKAMTD